VSAGVKQTFTQGNKFLVLHLLNKLVNGHGSNQLLVSDCLSALQGHRVCIGIDLGYLTLLSKKGLFLWQGLGHRNPDTTSTIAGGESESSIRSPISSGLVENDVSNTSLDIWCRDTLSEPGALHLEKMTFRFSKFRRKVRSALTLVVGTAQTL
jgi:hypothetical protein